MRVFKDREAAGQLLANRLQKYRGKSDVLILAIPRGGVVVAKEVAKNLNLPLDTIITRKIGAPTQPELALGAVDEDGEVMWAKDLLADLKLDPSDLKDQVDQQKQEIKRRGQAYRQGNPPQNIEAKAVVVVDDGIATGATILSALKFLKRHQVKKIIVGIPVASQDSILKVSNLADEVVVLYTPEDFKSVGQFYHQFEPVEDERVIQLLNE